MTRFLEINSCKDCYHLYEEVCHNPKHKTNFIVGSQIKYKNEFGTKVLIIPDECKLSRGAAHD